MNYELFIAKRILTNKKDKGSISSPIIKIAIVAITLGMVVMLISVATGLGLKYKIRDKISSLNGHILISKFNQSNAENSQNPIVFDTLLKQQIEGVSGVKNIQSFATKNGMIRTATDFEMVVYKGVSKNFDWSLFKEYIIKGDMISLDVKQSKAILISENIAKKMHFKVNDKVVMWFLDETKKTTSTIKAKPRSFIISGIYKTGIKEYDSHYVIGDLEVIQRLNKWKTNQIGGLEINLDNFEELNSVSNTIYDEIDPSLNTTTVTQKFKDLFEWISMFDINITLIIVIMIIISGINMITALLVLILERTQMIGILKALGNNNKSIRKIFLYNATYIILKGLFYGNLIGLGLIFVEKYFRFIQLDSDSYYVSNVPYHISFSQIVLLNLGTLILCVIMLIVPTYLVSKINPVKAIKFD